MSEPLPGSLATSIVPPSMVQKCLLMVSPRPVPPYLRVVDASAWVNAWNSRPICSVRHADAGIDDAEDEAGVIREHLARAWRA